MIENLSFAFFSVVVLSFFLVAVLSKNMLYSLASLAGGMVFLSGFYFLLDAEFIGVIQIIVYSGAVLGLFSFAMMFFDTKAEFIDKIKGKKSFFISVILSLVFLIAAIFSIKFISNKADLSISGEIYNINEQLALAIFSKYLLAFEFVAILLLIALICAVVLTHKSLAKEQKC